MSALLASRLPWHWSILVSARVCQAQPTKDHWAVGEPVAGVVPLATNDLFTTAGSQCLTFPQTSTSEADRELSEVSSPQSH